MDQSGWLAAIGSSALDVLAALPQGLIAVLAALIGAATGFALLWRSMRGRGGAVSAGIETSDGSVLLFRGRRLCAMNDAAAAMLAELPGEGSELDRLCRWVEGQSPELAAEIAALLDTGKPFAANFSAGDGRNLELRGETRGALVALILRETSLARRGQIEAEERLQRIEEENRALRALVNAAPVAMWRRRPSGEILWANAAYDREAADHGELTGWSRFPFAGPTEGLGQETGGRAPRRMALYGKEGERRWFDVLERGGEEGEIVGAAVNVDQIVRVEAALKRFVETLTETFAHLPIGLAVFDKNRRLGLFNPAISDILKLDPAWLATRPGLRDFLERLRENRQMPDQPDFLAWRRKLTTLERDAEAAAYEEDWVLPSGQTLRVIGRPHPLGAIAFLFEDISATVMIERRYRSEIEMLRAVLQKFPEAIVLFGPDGMLAYANTAFRSVWGFDAGLGQTAPHVSRLIDRWASLSEPSPVWRELKDFATGREARSAWTERVALTDGRILRARVAPLPDGSTLACFWDETDRERMLARLHERIAALEAERDLRLSRIAELQEGADGGLVRLSELAERLAKGDGGPVWNELSDAVAELKFGLGALGEAAEADAAGDAGPADLGRSLRAVQGSIEEAARERGVTLSVEGIDELALPEMPPGRLRQILFNFLTEAVSACPDRACVEIAAATEGDQLRLTARAPLAEGPRDPAATGVAGALLRRILRMEGGEVSLGPDAEGAMRVLTCTLPLRPGTPTRNQPRSIAGSRGSSPG
ncbi:MAG TPA: PAS-domain containing protein [Paracoccaceae bacterium]|nr:PAS-domain containing protein [Paracoccaceae bacterium]